MRDTARAMSQENVELVEALIDAFNRRDLKTLADLSHEDFEFVSVLAGVDADGATFRGSSAWASYIAAMDETWTEWRAVDFRIFDAGDDRLACLFRLVGEGRLSGVPVDRAVGITYDVRDGQFWRVRSYPNPSDALEAAGLSE